MRLNRVLSPPFAPCDRLAHMEPMEKLLFVALGGAFGSVCRYLTGMTALKLLGPNLGWSGTFTVNIVGGALMGLLVGFLAHRGDADQERLRVLLAVGVLGGFTTFSSFSLDSALMIERREYGLAAAYVLASVALSILALFAGLMAARKVFA
jgi:CrcB protein